jgi:hypothetical protein
MSPCSEDATLERVRFFPRQLIAADDLNQEQTYHRQRLRNHNRFLHGWGVVCGCDVRAAGDAKKPWQVRICPGYVLTPQGDEVYISTEAMFDVATCITQSSDPCAFSRPCPPVTLRAKATQTLYLAVRHVECQSRPVRVAPSGCACDDVDCEYSRIRDGYEFCCLSALPASHEETPPSCEELCRPTGVLPCPSNPDDVRARDAHGTGALDDATRRRRPARGSAGALQRVPNPATRPLRVPHASKPVDSTRCSTATSRKLSRRRGLLSVRRRTRDAPGV